MHTDYLAHDRQYQRRRAEGRPGWGTAADVAENTGHLERALARGWLPPGGRVLELGCGAGDLSLWLAARGFMVQGVDVAPTAVVWAREKAESRGLAADFRVDDVRELSGYADGAFDVVLDGCCLHCVIGEDRGRMLRSVRRVLRPAGTLFVMTMCGDPVEVDPRQRFDAESRCLLFGELALRYYGLPEALREEVRQAGFSLAHWEVVPAPGPRDQPMLLMAARREANQEEASEAGSAGDPARRA